MNGLHTIKFYFIVSVIILFGVLNSNGQIGGTNESCDGNRVAISSIIRMYQDSFASSIKDPRYSYRRPVIIIGRLGKNESNSKYTRQRMNETKSYFWRKEGFPKELIITAQGAPTNDRGSVEIYYAGVLEMTITLKRNQYLNLTRCMD